MLHHPWIAGMVAWWAVLAVVLKLDAGALLVGLLPTLAIVLNYFLSRRQRKQLTSKVEEVRVTVDGRLSTALDRIAALEAKLELAPGAPIPTAAVVVPPPHG